jgi:hypothetical protein
MGRPSEVRCRKFDLSAICIATSVDLETGVEQSESAPASVVAVLADRKPRTSPRISHVAGLTNWFDKRGTGLSDRSVPVPTLEQRMDDVRGVMDAVGSERATILGVSEGGPMSALFAATYPKRTTALVSVWQLRSRCLGS